MDSIKIIEDAPDMLEAAINFWFSDNNHIRCPFPESIKNELAFTVKEKFSSWLSKLSNDAEKEINDDVMAEKFEEMLFETALHLVKTEDERITIQYPFMIRVGDEVESVDKEKSDHTFRSKVTSRKLAKREDNIYLQVTLQNLNTNEIWETEFEIAA